MSDFMITKAEEKDIPLILKFIKELSVYEKMEQEVVANETLLKEWLFEKMCVKP